MLVLTRRANETIVIGDKIKVVVVSLEPDKVRLGIEAPPEVSIVREELLNAVRTENLAAAHTPRVCPLDLPRGPGSDEGK